MDSVTECVRRARAGDDRAFDELVRRFQDMAVGYAYSRVRDYHLAEDAAQEAFLAAWRNLHQLSDGAAFPGWLRAILHSQCHRVIRAGKPLLPIEVAENHPSGLDPQYLFDEKTEREAVQAAVSALPPSERETVTLFYMGGYSHREIGEFLGVPVSTVKNRLYSARKRLKERMISMVEGYLHKGKPSKDERFAELIRLRRAVETGDAGSVEEILSRSPDLSLTVLTDRDPRGETLLHRVMGYGSDGEGHDHIAELLLKYGADVNASGWGDNNPGGTPLMVAAWAGHEGRARLLLRHGADPNLGIDPAGKPWWRGDKMRPIETAAVHGYSGIVRALIEAGADYSITHTVLAGLDDLTERLLEEDTERLHRPDQGAYPLHRALEWHFHPQTFRLLLDRGADPNVADDRGRTPLHVALESGKTDAAQELLHRGTRVDVFAAAGLGDMERVRAVVKEDMERVHASQPDGVTPLFYAANAGSAEVCRFLLEHGAKQNAPSGTRDWRGWGAKTPLLIAAMQGHTEVCRALLEYGADTEAEPATPALVWAARRGHLEVVELLLDAGADLHARADYGPSALDWAIWIGHEAMVRRLLERGYDVNLPPLDTKEELPLWTALHYAAQHGRAGIARLLIEKGADQNVVDRNGRTPLTLAKEMGHAETAEALEGA